MCAASATWYPRHEDEGHGDALAARPPAVVFAGGHHHGGPGAGLDRLPQRPVRRRPDFRLSHAADGPLAALRRAAGQPCASLAGRPRQQRHGGAGVDAGRRAGVPLDHARGTAAARRAGLFECEGERHHLPHLLRANQFPDRADRAGHGRAQAHGRQPGAAHGRSHRADGAYLDAGGVVGRQRFACARLARAQAGGGAPGR